MKHEEGLTLSADNAALQAEDALLRQLVAELHKQQY
jgi:hypothetical protein